MLYVALGDSVTYGYSSSQGNRAYPQRVAKALSQKQTVNVYLQAKPGWTSRQLLKSLDDIQDCIWEEAKLVTLMVGGNDLLRASPWVFNGNHGHLMKVVDRYHEHLSQIVEKVKRRRFKFIIATLYNPFPNSLMVDEYTRLVNESIRRVAKRYRLILAPIDKKMRGKEEKLIDGYKRGTIRDFRLVGNPIHPNDAGHEAIASAVLATYRQSIVRQLPRQANLMRTQS